MGPAGDPVEADLTDPLPRSPVQRRQGTETLVPPLPEEGEHEVLDALGWEGQRVAGDPGVGEQLDVVRQVLVPPEAAGRGGASAASP